MFRKRLSNEKYRTLCRLLDERDGGCLLCCDPNVNHHHVVFRSAGGDDALNNMVCLCQHHHETCAHGVKKKYWRKEFQKYLGREEIRRWNDEHAGW